MTPRFTILSFFFSMFSLKISLSLFLEIPAYAAVHQGFYALTGVKVFVKCVEDFNDIARSEVQLNHIFL